MSKQKAKILIEWTKWESPLTRYSEDEPYEEDKSMAYSKLFMKILEKEFNLWTVHTNFYIDPNVARGIEFTEGVETLDIISPYRARVGIGRLFDEEDVQVRVRRSIQRSMDRRAKGAKVSFLDAVNKLMSESENDDENQENHE